MEFLPLLPTHQPPLYPVFHTKTNLLLYALSLPLPLYSILSIFISPLSPFSPCYSLISICLSLFPLTQTTSFQGFMSTWYFLFHAFTFLVFHWILGTQHETKAWDYFTKALYIFFSFLNKNHLCAAPTKPQNYGNYVFTAIIQSGYTSVYMRFTLTLPRATRQMICAKRHPTCINSLVGQPPDQQVWGLFL